MRLGLDRGASGGRRSGGGIIADDLQKSRAGYFKLEQQRPSARTEPYRSRRCARPARGLQRHAQPVAGRQMRADSEPAQCRNAGAGRGPLADLPPQVTEKDVGRLDAGAEEDAAGPLRLGGAGDT